MGFLDFFSSPSARAAREEEARKDFWAEREAHDESKPPSFLKGQRAFADSLRDKGEYPRFGHPAHTALQSLMSGMMHPDWYADSVAQCGIYELIYGGRRDPWIAIERAAELGNFEAHLLIVAFNCAEGDNRFIGNDNLLRAVELTPRGIARYLATPESGFSGFTAEERDALQALQRVAATLGYRDYAQKVARFSAPVL